MDIPASLQSAVQQACASHAALAVQGSGSKTPLLGSQPAEGQILSLADYTGVVQYQPAELVVTVRAGTPLKDLFLELTQQNQGVAAEPPLLQGGGTVGGAVAAGFSGPARPWSGSLRDAVLGVKMINGQGEILNFGGQVMKNVAGYDLSRLMTGSMGSLGVILEASIRVQPRVAHELTLVYELDAEAGVELCRGMARRALPLTATYWCDRRLYVRFGGSEATLHAAREKVGGELVETVDLWQRVRDHRLEFFKPSSLAHSGAGEAALELFCMVTPPAAPLNDLDTSQLAIEWAGGRRWFWHSDAAHVESYVATVGGWAWQVGAPVKLPVAQKLLMERIKRAFDPQGVFVSPTSLERFRAD